MEMRQCPKCSGLFDPSTTADSTCPLCGDDLTRPIYRRAAEFFRQLDWRYFAAWALGLCVGLALAIVCFLVTDTHDSTATATDDVVDELREVQAIIARAKYISEGAEVFEASQALVDLTNTYLRKAKILQVSDQNHPGAAEFLLTLDVRRQKDDLYIVKVNAYLIPAKVGKITQHEVIAAYHDASAHKDARDAGIFGLLPASNCIEGMIADLEEARKPATSHGGFE